MNIFFKGWICMVSLMKRQKKLCNIGFQVSARTEKQVIQWWSHEDATLIGQSEDMKGLHASWAPLLLFLLQLCSQMTYEFSLTGAPLNSSLAWAMAGHSGRLYCDIKEFNKHMKLHLFYYKIFPRDISLEALDNFKDPFNLNFHSFHSRVAFNIFYRILILYVKQFDQPIQIGILPQNWNTV